jgi:ubiquinone/menaquinone biosynthesis C-methylase UbiE
MVTITHQEQQERWDKEHKTPNVLPQMDSSKASSGVIKFLEWLKSEGKQPYELSGLEMCCGKGRNVIGLAVEGVNMVGLDFSQSAIEEAKKRATDVGVADKTQFFVHDVTKPFPIEAGSLDFAFDCFGSTDIENAEGRKAALDNLVNVLKPGGYLMVYLLSSDDEFQKEMAQKSPGPDEGSFIHTVNGKYEKAFTEDEVKDFYKDLKLCVFERVAKTDMFFGKEYKANHIWAVFQKQ